MVTVNCRALLPFLAPSLAPLFSSEFAPNTIQTGELRSLSCQVSLRLAEGFGISLKDREERCKREEASPIIAVNVRTSEEDLIMTSQTPVTDRVLGQVQRTHGCDLDTLTKSLSDLSWSQVFLEVDRLSRDGQIQVTLDNEGRYMIRLPDHNKEPRTRYVRS
jgi:hypothetical protein